MGCPLELCSHLWNNPHKRHAVCSDSKSVIWIFNSCRLAGQSFRCIGEKSEGTGCLFNKYRVSVLELHKMCYCSVTKGTESYKNKAV